MWTTAKPSLLQAITGVNADRLPEEKSRGMTIDLGYAYWPQPDGRVLGFIDVPGHEKFLSNMLAGVGRDRHALLVVACDDGVMAQTREHRNSAVNGKTDVNRCVDQNGPCGRGAGCRSPGTGGIR